MTLSSPFEDLQSFTLRAIAGSLRKLEYLASLRDSAGRYAHWGFERVYGDITSEKTMQRAHRGVLSRILATPLRELTEEVKSCGDEAELPAAVYLEQLSARGSALLPSDPGAGTERHLNSVLHALSELEKNHRRAATHLGA
jgi:hypothetical protein